MGLIRRAWGQTPRRSSPKRRHPIKLDQTPSNRKWVRRFPTRMRRGARLKDPQKSLLAIYRSWAKHVANESGPRIARGVWSAGLRRAEVATAPQAGAGSRFRRCQALRERRQAARTPNASRNWSGFGGPEPASRARAGRGRGLRLERTRRAAEEGKIRVSSRHLLQ